jgi:hypothetical protein
MTITSRLLVLVVDGDPVCWAHSAEALRALIGDYPDDDLELFKVWSLFNALSLAPPEDITKQFAKDWSELYEFGDGIEPSEYLARYPGFVRAHYGAELHAIFEKAVTRQHEAAE